jgi:hypothetical protein
MEKLGYIVADRKPNNLKGFVEFTSDFSSVDSTKPVLIIGYKRAKEILGDKFNILDKNISKNVSWTFKKTEKRIDYDEDIDKFYKACINNIIYNIKYYYINIIKLKYNKIKKLYNIIFSNNKKYIYINNGMLYLKYNDCVMGISLTILQYCGINTDKILTRITNNSSNVVYNETTPFVKELKKEIGNNKEYAIPYFMSME